MQLKFAPFEEVFGRLGPGTDTVEGAVTDADNGTELARYTLERSLLWPEYELVVVVQAPNGCHSSKKLPVKNGPTEWNALMLRMVQRVYMWMLPLPTTVCGACVSAVPAGSLFCPNCGADQEYLNAKVED